MRIGKKKVGTTQDGLDKYAIGTICITVAAGNWTSARSSVVYGAVCTGNWDSAQGSQQKQDYLQPPSARILHTDVIRPGGLCGTSELSNPPSKEKVTALVRELGD